MKPSLSEKLESSGSPMLVRRPSGFRCGGCWSPRSALATLRTFSPPRRWTRSSRSLDTTRRMIRVGWLPGGLGACRFVDGFRAGGMGRVWPLAAAILLRCLASFSLAVASSVISPSEMDTRFDLTGLVAGPRSLLSRLISVEEDGARSSTGAGRLGLGGRAYMDLNWEDL